MTPTEALRDAAALLRELAARIIADSDGWYPETARRYNPVYQERYEAIIEPAKRGIALADQIDTITG